MNYYIDQNNILSQIAPNSLQHYQGILSVIIKILMPFYQMFQTQQRNLHYLIEHVQLPSFCDGFAAQFSDLQFQQARVIQNNILMLRFHSQGKLEANKSQSLVLPKLKSFYHQGPQTQRSNSLRDSRNRIKNAIIMKTIKPSKDLQQTSEEQDQKSTIIKNIEIAEKLRLKPEIAVLSLNSNRNQRPKQRFIKDIFIGEEAVNKFYDRYKNLEKYQRKEQYLNQTNVLTQMIQLLEAYGFAPRKLDLIKVKGSHAMLDLKKLGLGQGNLGPLIAELMRLMQHFEYVDLSYNCIDRSTSEQLVSCLRRVKIINLSGNRIGKAACDTLAQMLYDSKTCIEELYLSDNNLMDNAGAALAKALADYTNLRVLDLSKNFLSSRFALQLRQYLSKDDYLQELYLGWNEIVDKSCKNIFESIAKHQQLKVFDYSWNLIGIFSVDSFAKMLQENQSILHLDVSFCDINKQCTKIIAQALESNHNIYGMHYEGNSGYIDQKGFLKSTLKQFNEYPMPIVRGIIRKMDSVRPNPVKNQYRQSEQKDVCWICQSWQEAHFQVPHDDLEVKQCYLHLKQEGYRAVKMQAGLKKFELHRVLPQGNIEFFFTYYRGPSAKTHFASLKYPNKPLNQVIRFQMGTLTVTQNIPAVNYIQNSYKNDIISSQYLSSIVTVPRCQDVPVNYSQKQQTQYIEAKPKPVKKVRVKKKVIRKERLQMKFRQLDNTGAEQFMRDLANRDNDKDYLLKCIQFDVANSKIPKIIKNSEDLDKFKSMMVGYYRDFKDVFYYLANSNPSAVSSVFSIPEVVFQQFLEEQKYITKRVTQAKTMLKMYSCLSSVDDQASVITAMADKKRNQVTKLFVRPQFMEFLIRLAIEKWCPPTNFLKKKKQQLNSKTKQKQEKKSQDQQQQVNKKQKIVLPLPLLEGLQRTMKTLTKYAARVRASVWRIQRYLTVDMYTVIKGYESFLTDIYVKYSENKKKLDKPKKLKGLLTLEQFINMFLDAEIKRTRESACDCNAPFLDSKRLQIEDGFLQFGLNYQQFLQCLARYSQILWFPPVTCRKHPLWQQQPSRRFVPLFLRFQSLIVALYRNHSQLHSRRMDKICERGIFPHESQVLQQKVSLLVSQYQSDLMWKINNMEEEEISLQELIDGVKSKYQNAMVEVQGFVEQQHQVQT